MIQIKKGFLTNLPYILLDNILLNNSTQLLLSVTTLRLSSFISINHKLTQLEKVL